jgi:hypothetical protein
MPLPPLYHYTAAEALHGIIMKKEIWFTDIRFLNDRQEFHHTCGLMSDCIKYISGKHRDNWISRGCRPEAFDQMVANMMSKVGDSDNYLIRHSIEGGFPFVFSLSAESDSLSQWRAYGNAEVCIEFDSDVLSESIARPQKVQYVTRDGRVAGIFIESVTRFFVDHLMHINNGWIDPEVMNDGIDDFRFPSSIFMSYKNPAFSDEKEWRLSLDILPEDDSIFFCTAGRYLVPRAKIPFEPKNAIKSVMFGPETDESMARASIVMFNRRYGTNFGLTFSKVPYRSK